MNVLLHPRTAAALSAVAKITAGSFLLYGPTAIGKATAATEIARSLSANQLHPDLHMIQPEDKPSITIAQIRTLVRALSLQPYYATGLRTVIVDNANAMTTEAQNALLKVLEEPPPNTIFLLVAERPESLLITVRSRCAAIYFALPPPENTIKWLTKATNITPNRAAELVAAAGNLPGRAYALATDTAVAEAELEIARAAVAAPTKTRFERLQLAARLATAAADPVRFGRAVQQNLVERLHTGDILPNTAAGSLSALEQFRRHTAAGVAPRVALERLMLEL